MGIQYPQAYRQRYPASVPGVTVTGGAAQRLMSVVEGEAVPPAIGGTDANDPLRARGQKGWCSAATYR
jgi:hypothetical protein